MTSLTRTTRTVNTTRTTRTTRTNNFKFTFPASCLLIGRSGAGKTWYLVNLIKRGKIHPKGGIETIVILNPSKMSLEQPLYNELIPFCKNIIKVHLGPKTEQPECFQDLTPKLCIVDDIDDVRVAPQWVRQLTTVASHHTNTFVAMTSHTYFLGSVPFRQSFNYIIIFDIPGDGIKKTLIGLDIGSKLKEVLQMFSNPIGIKNGKNRNGCLIDFTLGTTQGETKLFNTINI
jgi:hypothetical protein